MTRASDPTDTALMLNPAGFTAMLRRAGSLPQGRVISFEITRRIQTTVSNLCFAAAGYDRQAPPLPTRVLIKWPIEASPAPERGTPEVMFYTELARSLGSPPVVHCLGAAPLRIGQQWLVLEDLRSTHTNPPWPQPPTPAQAEGAVSILAQIHAHWWEAPTLGTSVGSWHSEAGLRAMVEGIATRLPAFLGALGDTVTRRDRRLLETVFGSSLAPWLRLADPRALTVTHGDAHTWNFLFPRSGTGLPYLVDWQLWHLDLGARDLAFMIALHWDAALRQKIERPLLELYHRHVTDAGVSGYPLEDLWLDYRRCVVRNLTFPIILWSRGLPDEAWRHRLACALAAYRDLHCDELL